MTGPLVAALALAVAFANGANDNSKGVATLLGSGTAGYRAALRWATAMTFLGSLFAALLSEQLFKAFSGAGLVSPGLAASPDFLTAAAAGTAGAVLGATALGLPVSTTHAVLGALVGAGLVLQGSIAQGPLWRSFVLPLALVPVVALTFTAAAYPALRWVRLRWGVGPATPVALGLARAQRSSGGCLPAMAAQPGADQLQLVTVSARRVLTAAHFLSGGALSFARGLNDAPKIAALLIASGMAGRSGALALVAAAMAAGGMLAARRVATTMSTGITSMNDGQGFSANAVAAILLIGASLAGLPASTTHLSCGALFGLGAITQQARWRTVVTVTLAWGLTLPAAAAIAALTGCALRLVSGR